MSWAEVQATAPSVSRSSVRARNRLSPQREDDRQAVFGQGQRIGQPVQDLVVAHAPSWVWVHASSIGGTGVMPVSRTLKLLITLNEP